MECFETPNEAFIRKMRSENTLGMFFEWCERAVRLGMRNVLRICEIIVGLNML